VIKQTKHSIKSHRYELVHGEDDDFIAYQRKFGDGLWQTVSTWMIPVRSIGSRSLLERRSRCYSHISTASCA
jgi:hypothetical protein